MKNKKSSMYDFTTLVIGDSHVEVEQDLSRFQALGNIIIDRQPEEIVQIGDFMSYDSISSHNKSKRLTLEGQRCKLELEAGREAYNMLMAPMHARRSRMRKYNKKQYTPKLVWVEGNHEDRALRYTEEHPEVEGLVDYKNVFNPADDGWLLVPYRSHYINANIAYTHVPMNAVNSPIGSKHSVKNCIKDYRTHVVYGHTHKLVHESDGVLGPHGPVRQTATTVGCFFEETPQYAAGSQGSRDWWHGLVFLHHYGDSFDIEAIDLQVIKRHYL